MARANKLEAKGPNYYFGSRAKTGPLRSSQIQIKDIRHHTLDRNLQWSMGYIQNEPRELYLQGQTPFAV